MADVRETRTTDEVELVSSNELDAVLLPQKHDMDGVSRHRGAANEASADLE